MASSSETKMTGGSIYRQMLGFAIPLFISQLFQQLYNTADSIIVGKLLGTDALAAVSSSGNLVFLIISFFEGTAMGASVLISKRYGEGDSEGVSRAVHTNIAFGLASGLFLTVAGYFFIDRFLLLMKIDPDILPRALSYYRIFFLGSVGHVLYGVCRGIMMAVGDSKRPLIYLIVSSVINIILDILFVGVFRWDVWSAALATIISQFLSALLCMNTLMHNGGSVAVRLKDIRFHKQEMIMLLKIGLPSGVQNSVIGFANVIVQAQINGFGKIATAAHGAYAKIEGFAFLPITSFTMSISTFVGQNLGAKQYDRTKSGARFGIVSAVIFAEIAGIMLIVLSKPMLMMFTDDPEVVLYGRMQMLIDAPFYCLLAYAHSISAVCKGAGKAVVPMTIMLSVWCVLRIAWILTTMHLFSDIRFVYWAYPLTWGISCIIYCIYYYKSDWIHGYDRQKPRRESI